MPALWPASAPEGSPSKAGVGPRAIQRSPRSAKEEQLEPQRLPKWSPKTGLFGNVVKSQILEDVPYEINEFGAPGPQKTDPKSIQEAGACKRPEKGGQKCHQGHPGGLPREPRGAGPYEDASSDPQGPGPGILVI